MEKILTPKCHICQENDYRALYCDEVYKAKAPKSQKTILDIIRHISRVLKVQFHVPARARVCSICYKELVRYDCYVVELLEVQKCLSEKINARIKGVKVAKPKPKFDDNSGDEFDDDGDNDDDDDEDDGDDDLLRSDFIDDDDNELVDTSAEPETTEIKDEFISTSGEQQEHSSEKKTKPDNYPCTVCNLKLKNKRALEYHLNKDHKNRVTCNVCGVQVRNDEYLVLHMNIHNGKTENDCAFCEKSYARRVNVIRHMQVHFNKNQHQCERCGMSFTQTTIFYNHRLQHEAEDNPLICSVCGQSFKTKRTYKRHMITHQEDRPRYNCEYCGKVFVDKYTLKMHIRTHHTNASGGDESQENVTTQAQAPKKQKVATEEPEQVLFTCVICQHIFLRRDLFNDHMQNVHDVVIDT